jgi:adenylosuccinate synthase
MTILLALLIISTAVDEDLSTTSLIRQCAYNYITCLSNSINYLGENVSVFSQIKNKPYEKIYTKVMKNRSLIKHYVNTGESIDQIIKTYNSNIDKDIDDFREVVYKENQGIVSSDYNVQAGEYILVPSNNND